jgi:starch-binding outer membrane protein, SusD/RagB family
MKKTITVWAILLVLLPFAACKKEFLDKDPLDQYGEKAVWSDLALMETFVNNIYYEIPTGFTGKISLEMLCDEAMRVADRGAQNVTNSLVSPSDYSVFGSQIGPRRMTWDYIYRNIRACNLFLQEVAKNTYQDKALRDRLIGEVHFLRAYHYHTLAFMYGGFPLIENAYELSDDPLIGRDSFQDCIKFIADDCDKAAALLPLSHTSNNLGRATRGAALALKARVLLYAASDLYNNQAWATGFAKPELVGYVGGDRMARWKAARDAAKAVMDLNVYDLYKKNPAPGDDIAKNYTSIFLAKQTPEDIFVRFYVQASQETAETYNPGLHNSSNGYHGHGSNNPIGQAVDAYDMKDGSRFDWNNAAHKANPYQNRDPRLYANILFDGAAWRQRPVDVQSLDPVGIIQTGLYQQPDKTWKGGIDTRSSPIEDWNGTGSGYYRRKFIDPAYNPQYEVQENPWRYIRYAEILLSYAEACQEVGDDAEAGRAVNLVRNRAGMPNVADGDLRESIRHERRVELMFEGQRYFDIRRWMTAPRVMVDAQGIEIRYALGEIKPTYKVITVQKRNWKNQSYLLPIRLEEINKNSLLVQNPLY